MSVAGFVPCSALIHAHPSVLNRICPQEKRRIEHLEPSFFPVSTSLPIFSSISHSTPPFVGLQRRKTALLWLRLGHLRLADNLAVRSASLFDGPVLPVVTIQQKEVSDASTAAIAALKSAFEALGSTIVMHIVGDRPELECEVVRKLVQVARSKVVILNGARDTNDPSLQGLRQSGCTLRICHGRKATMPMTLCPVEDSVLCEGPKWFPRLPDVVYSLSSTLQLSGKVPCGEVAARRKLFRLVQLQKNRTGLIPPLTSLYSSLRQELYMGTISRERVVCEHRRMYSTEPTPQVGFSHSIRSFFNRFCRTPAMASLSIAAYDVNGSDRRGVEWDEETKSFRLKEWEHKEPERRMTPKERWNEFWRRRRLFFIRSFFPEDVTPDYYSFTAWRFSQRCVSATIGVFGTSSLLFAIGIRSGRIGQAAVISWVLKDGLGRVGKMLWAGSMGKDFDVDPKRWRFRSALLYAVGNGLEIVTQIFPASFLVFATLANSMKQVSMLTASATRNAMYRSFGELSQNIANITAKGEAQIVVADLIGMACGIRLSKVFGASKEKVLGMYMILTALDIFGIYMELRQVVFRTMNAERSNLLVNHYVQNGECLTPSDVSPQERIFLKPKYMAQVRLSSIANAAKDPKELDMLLHIFRKEHFIVSMPGPTGQCRLVLRNNASNADVLRAILMTGYVRKALNGRQNYGSLTLEQQESILRNAWKASKRNFPVFLDAAKTAGWSTRNLLFSTMKRRGYWGHQHSRLN